jgi:predicted permease
MDSFWASAIWSILPTLGVGLIFWFIMRAVIQADKQERKAYAAIEAKERARMGVPAPDADR